jgi:hypothetical protein
MTAACLVLIAATRRPLWPWTRGKPGTLVEAFPAAQLVRWKLPHEGYAGPAFETLHRRALILGALRERIGVPAELMSRIESSADALDAVLCAFAGIAATGCDTAALPTSWDIAEGWIAVHA